jgi:formate dehydrogenase subunit delta
LETPAVVRLANDIAAQFAYKSHDDAVASIAGHIKLFWDPRMRRQLDEYARAEHVDFTPLALDAAHEVGRTVANS